MREPWIISLISTDYDLKNERKAIIEFLKSYEIEVSAFEEPKFPVPEGYHSHDVCIHNLERANIAILLINERYGGFYYADKGVSITEKEYELLNVPTIVLVNKKVWDERAIYRKQQKSSGLSEEEYAKSGKYNPHYVQNVNVFCFIDKIQKSYETKGRSNWLNFWDNPSDLTRILPDVLSSRSGTILHDILDKQIKEVKSKKTSTALSMSLGDVFDKGYYIEPGVTCVSGEIGDNECLTTNINNRLKEGDSCLVLGDAGAGKTTLMAKSFLEMAQDLGANSFIIPAYVWLRRMSPDSSFSIEKYLEDCCDRFLNKKPYPFFNLHGFSFIFYLDGFDELTEKISKEDLTHLYTSDFFKWPLMLTSRIQYADRYIISNEFASKFNCCIKLTDWNIETAKKYIGQFCELQGKDTSYVQRIMTLLVENRDLNDVLNSPLLITILLYVIEQSRMTIPETITSRVQLFEKCLNCLAQREIDKKNRTWDRLPDKDELILYWAHFAWAVYESRLGGKSNIRIEEVLDTIRNVYGGYEWTPAVYEVIFDTNGEDVFGAFHEQFLEFLVAYALVYACLNKKEPYPNFLKYVMRPEINRYFRGLVNRRSEKDRNAIFNNISTLYWNCLGKTENEAILKRVHAVYHLTRLTADGDAEQIERIFNVERERAVLQSLYFGVIKRGDMQKEQEFYELLNSDEGYSNSNRGYHLAYYDTIAGQVTIPYSDDLSVNWEGSLRAFQRHFSSDDLEHYHLRRIDLVTMRQFMEFRNKREPLNNEILETIEKQIGSTPRDANQMYQSLVEDEFKKLRVAYESFN